MGKTTRERVRDWRREFFDSSSIRPSRSHSIEDLEASIVRLVDDALEDAAHSVRTREQKRLADVLEKCQRERYAAEREVERLKGDAVIRALE